VKAVKVGSVFAKGKLRCHWIRVCGHMGRSVGSHLLVTVTSATLPKDASKFVTVNPRKDASIAVANTLDALILIRVQVDATAT
jgi:hypothetical protein